MSYKPFKMKGHTLPGINQKKADRTADGRPGSSALQMKSPMKADKTQKKGKLEKTLKKGYSKDAEGNVIYRGNPVPSYRLKEAYETTTGGKKVLNPDKRLKIGKEYSVSETPMEMKDKEIKKDLKGGREMLAAKKNPGKPKRVGTSIYSDTYQGTGDTKSTRKAEKKFAKADKKLAKGKLKAAARKVKKGRKTVVSMPSGPTTRKVGR